MVTPVQSLRSRTTLLLALFAPLAGVLAQERPPAPVEVEVVETGNISSTARLLGTAEAKRTSLVAAEIEGYVVDYPAREGAWVKKGDVLARLRDDTLKLQLKAAEAALLEVRARYRKAELDLKRAKELIEEDAVTQKELDTAEMEEATLKLQVTQNEAKVALLNNDIGKTIVTAPFDGQVVMEQAQVGEWVMRGGRVARLVDLSCVYVRVNVPERHIGFLEVGQKVPTSVGAARAETYLGTIISIAGEGDREARTFPVRVEIENDGKLRSGMSAQTELRAGAPIETLLVSKDAVMIQGQQSFVFVVEDGKVTRKVVQTGAASSSKLQVVSGLELGEVVVVKGNERLQPGAPVRIVASPRAKLPAESAN